jgi:hypothetical protein
METIYRDAEERQKLLSPEPYEPRTLSHLLYGSGEVGVEKRFRDI